MPSPASYQGFGSITVRSYRHGESDDPTVPVVPADHDISSLPFSVNPLGYGYGYVGGYSIETKDNWEILINGRPPPAGSPTGTPNSGGANNRLLAAQQVLSGTPAVPATDTSPEIPAVVGLNDQAAAAHDAFNAAKTALTGLQDSANAAYAGNHAASLTVYFAQNALTHAGKFGTPDAIDAAQAQLDAATASLATTLADNAPAIAAYPAGIVHAQQLNLAWLALVEQVILAQEVVARIELTITALQAAKDSAPSAPADPSPDDPPVTPYLTCLLDEGSLAGAFVVASCTYAAVNKNYDPGATPPDPAPHCEASRVVYDTYSLLNGDYQFNFTLGDGDYQALVQAGVQSVDLAWQELTVRYPLTLVSHPSTDPDNCPPYTVRQRDGNALPQATAVDQTETVSLDMGARTVEGDIVYWVFVSSVYSVPAPGTSTEADVEVRVGTYRMPATGVQMERQGAAARLVGFTAYTAASVGGTANLYLTETGTGDGYSGTRTIQQTPPVGDASPPDYIRPAWEMIEAGTFAPQLEFESPLTLTGEAQGDVGTSFVGPTSRSTANGYTATLSDAVDPAIMQGQVDDVAAIAWVDDPEDGSDPPDPPPYYGNVADASKTALHIAPEDGRIYAAQRARYKVTYPQFPSYPQIGPCPYRLRRTEWRLDESEPTVTYVDATHEFTREEINRGYVTPPDDFTEEPVPDENVVVLIEGCAIDDAARDAFAIFLDGSALITPHQET